MAAVLQSIVDYLRAGYPEGVPEQDYVPLFALLRRQLSDDELVAVADELVRTGSVPSRGQIEETIRRLTTVVPADADVARVRAQLAAGGWPLSDLEGEFG
jgi:uncharacterized protein DUF3349